MTFHLVSKLLSTTLLLVAVAPASVSADPGRPSGESGPAQVPPAQQMPPAAPPSRIDPGIQKAPETIPNPKSIVPPPVVDPKMAIDPERPGRPAHPKAQPPSNKPPVPGQ